jgi:DHA2 family multidrug resistance protein
MLARRTQVHQAELTGRIVAGNPQLQAMTQGAVRAMMAHGSSAALAAKQAYGLVAIQLYRQAAMLSYLDNFRILGMVIMCLVPIAFVMKKPKRAGMGAIH